MWETYTPDGRLLVLRRTDTGWLATCLAARAEAARPSRRSGRRSASAAPPATRSSRAGSPRTSPSSSRRPAETHRPGSVGGSARQRDAGERRVEDGELLRRADGDADRRRRAEAGERPDDHALLEQPLEERRRVVAELDVDEVADRARRRARARARAGSPSARSRPSRVQRAADASSSSGSPRLASAASCARRRDVEGAADLRHRRADVDGPDRVADPEPGEAVDLREGAQHDARAGRLDVALDRVGVVGAARRTRSRPGRSTTSTPAGSRSRKRVELGARVHRPGRVVRVADVDDLRPRRRSPRRAPRGRSGARAAAP